MEQLVFDALNSLKIEYKNHTHGPLFTVGQAEEFDNSIDATATKNLFLKDKKKNYFLITSYAYQDINLKDVAKAVGAKGTLSFVNAEILKQMMNLTPGSVTPFGLLYAKQNNHNINFYMDEYLINRNTIGIHPLRNDMTTVVNPLDLKKLLEHNLIDVNSINLA